MYRLRPIDRGVTWRLLSLRARNRSRLWFAWPMETLLPAGRCLEEFAKACIHAGTGRRIMAGNLWEMATWNATSYHSMATNWTF